MFETILLLIGLTGLWGGTLLTVRGAVELSERHGLSHGFIGLTILAIGTDLPELLVSLDGSFQHLRGVDTSGVIVGNATGSALVQGTLVLGVAGLVGYLRAAPTMVRRDGLALFLMIGLTTLMCLDGRVGRVEGGVMLIAYLMYFLVLVQAERGGSDEASTPSGKKGISPTLALSVGIVTVLLAAHVVVTEAIAIAEAWGITQTLVGVLIIGAGTSLPELALSVGAAKGGHTSLSVGNVIGSNIFDLLLPIGLAATISPLQVAPTTVGFDLPAIALASGALVVFLLHQRGIQHREAMALVALYVGYTVIRIAMV